MLSAALAPHPDQPPLSVIAIEVAVARLGATLRIQYRLTGAFDRITLPPSAGPARRDELWKTTCFEAFVKPMGAAAYFEFNASPSGAWAAYCFDDYRAGMANADVRAPRIITEHGAGAFFLEVEFGGLPDGAFMLGLAAVIEEAGGNKSYWALAHPPGKADFHHSDCFALHLPARAIS